MIKSEYLELIHQEIDQSISPENKNKLRAYLAKDKDAEILYNELIHSMKLLDELPQVEPPQDLSKRILNSLDFRLYPNRLKTDTRPTKLFDWFLKPTPRPAYAFAFGLILGLIVYACVIMLIYKEQPIDFADVYGTISTMENNRIENISNNPVDIPDIKGSINLRRYKSTIIFEMNLQPLQYFTLRMEFEQDYFDFSAYQPLCPVRAEFEDRDNMITLSGSQDMTFVLWFKKIQESTSPIELSIVTGDKILYRHEFLIKN